MTKECREKILRLKIIYFDEFRGPLKRTLRGPKGPLRAKSRSFGDRNIFLVSRLSVIKGALLKRAKGAQVATFTLLVIET